MKIGIVTTWFERGAAYVSKQLEKSLEERYEIFIYARGGESYAKDDPNWDKDNVTWGKRFPWYGPTQISINHFGKWINKNNIDIVIFNEQHDWEPVLFCLNKNVVTGAYIDYYKKETVPFFALYDFLICNTERHFSVFKWHTQAFYIPWGTDLKIFKPEDPLFKNKNTDGLVFFHSCGMNPHRKGTDLIIKAFKMLTESTSILKIHTQVSLEKFFPDLSQDISILKADGKLEVIDKTVHAPGLYHLGDIYLYPSRLDGIGLTIAEALACGLPVIVTDNQPMNEFVRNEMAGKKINIETELVRGDNYFWKQSIISVEHLCELVLSYEKCQEKLPVMKSNARIYAETYLDWKINIKKLISEIPRLRKIDPASKHAIVLEVNNYKKTIKLKDKISSSFFFKATKKLIKVR